VNLPAQRFNWKGLILPSLFRISVVRVDPW
jgi:hypothetical protein